MSKKLAKRDKPELCDLVWLWLDNNLPDHLEAWPRSNGNDKATLFFVSCNKEHDLIMLSIYDDVVTPGLYIREGSNKAIWSLISKFNEYSSEWFDKMLSTILVEEQRRGCSECR